VLLLVYMREVILTHLVMWMVEMIAVHRILITTVVIQMIKNSDNVTSSYSSENLSDDDGEELDIGKDCRLAVRNACTITAFQEAIGILRRHWHRVPKNARTLLHTPRHVQLQEKCGDYYIYFGLESVIIDVIHTFAAMDILCIFVILKKVFYKFGYVNNNLSKIT